MKKRKQDNNAINWQNIIIFLCAPIVFTAISLFTNPPFLVFILLFFGIPLIVLGSNDPKALRNTLFFSLSLAPVMVIIDYLTAINGSWSVSGSAFAYELFGIVSIEKILWAVLRIVLSLLVFEKLIKNREPQKDIVYWPLALFSSLLLMLFYIFIINTGSSINIKSLYTILIGIFGLIPFLYYFIKEKSLRKALIIACLALFYYCIFFEASGLTLGYWSFSGNDYIGSILLGDKLLPLEEIIWLMVGTGVIIAYYGMYNKLLKFLKK